MIKGKMLTLALTVQNNVLYKVMIVMGVTLATLAVSGDLSLAGTAVATTPLPNGGTSTDVITSLQKGTEKIFGQLALLSHPAAGVGIAIGALMKKFSMGRQDRVETGNKLIKDSVIGWGTINGVNAIIGTVQDILK